MYEIIYLCMYECIYLYIMNYIFDKYLYKCIHVSKKVFIYESLIEFMYEYVYLTRNVYVIVFINQCIDMYEF